MNIIYFFLTCFDTRWLILFAFAGLLSSLKAQEANIITPRPLETLDAMLDPIGIAPLSIVKGKQSSEVHFADNHLKLPPHVWVTTGNVSLDQRRAVFVAFRTDSQTGAGLWYWGLITVEVEPANTWSVSFSMLDQDLEAIDNRRRTILKIRSIENYPRVEVEVSTGPVGSIGNYERKIELWDIVKQVQEKVIGPVENS